MVRKWQSLSEALRQILVDCGLTHSALATKSGVQRMSIVRFLRGKQSLRLKEADKLAALFGLEIVQRKHRKDK